MKVRISPLLKRILEDSKAREELRNRQQIHIDGKIYKLVRVPVIPLMEGR